MPKPLRKTIRYEIKMTPEEHNRISRFTFMHNKRSMAEYILSVALSPVNHQKTDVITTCLEEQRRTMHILLQFVMYIASFSKTQENVMKFYESARKSAIAEFGKEES